MFIMERGENESAADTLLMLCEHAERRYASALQRSEDFPGIPITDPVWMIMLYMFARTIRGQRIFVTDATNAANAPMTTALRYISNLLKLGYIDRTEDPFDRRRGVLTLTEETQRDVAKALLLEIGKPSTMAVGIINSQASFDHRKRLADSDGFEIVTKEVERIQRQLELVTSKLAILVGDGVDAHKQS